MSRVVVMDRASRLGGHPQKGRNCRHTAGDWRGIEKAFIQLWPFGADEAWEADAATQCQYWLNHAGGDPYELASQAPCQHL